MLMRVWSGKATKEPAYNDQFRIRSRHWSVNISLLLYHKESHIPPHDHALAILISQHLLQLIVFEGIREQS